MSCCTLALCFGVPHCNSLHCTAIFCYMIICTAHSFASRGILHCVLLYQTVTVCAVLQYFVLLSSVPHHSSANAGFSAARGILHWVYNSCNILYPDVFLLYKTAIFCNLKYTTIFCTVQYSVLDHTTALPPLSLSVPLCPLQILPIIPSSQRNIKWTLYNAG